MAELRKSSRRRIIGFVGAVSMGCAVALHPSVVAAASTLYGLVSEAGGSPVFGSIDPATGSFTQIGNASEPIGYYAPVYDPARNVFYVTISPINGTGLLGGFDEINAATGAITQVVLPLLGPEEPQFVAGLGVDTNNGQLYGLVSEAGGSPVFGSIDPATGSFTQIGNASEPIGYYAPVYDPARNVFYVTISPINGTGLLGGFDEINAATGAITQVVLPLLGPEEPQFVAGLGVDTNNGQLYGLVSEAGGSPVFGSIDPATGSFTQIGNASEPIGYYAPVYNPARNVFYVTISPINGTGLLGGFDEINAATGAITQVVLPLLGPEEPQFVAGLGVAVENSVTSAPEPTSIVQLLTYIFGIGVVLRRARVKI